MFNNLRSKGEDNMKLSFLAGVKYNNRIYFSAMNTNMLFYYDCEKRETKYVCDFGKEEAKECLHSCAYLYREDIWFIPWQGRYLIKFNISTQEVEYFDVPDFNGDGYAYREYVVYKDSSLFMIPSGMDSGHLIRVDLDTNKIKDCGDASPKGAAHCAGGYIRNDEVLIVSAEGAIYSKYNILDDCLTTIGKAAPSGYQSLIKAGDKIVLIPMNNDEIKMLDMDGNPIWSLHIGKNYYFGLVAGNKVWVFPFDTNRIAKGICVNDETYKVCSKEIQVDDSERWLNLRNIFTNDNELWVTTTTGKLWKVDDEIDIIEDHDVEISEEEEMRMLDMKSQNGKYIFDFSQIIYEGAGVASLKGFIFEITHE